MPKISKNLRKHLSRYRTYRLKTRSRRTKRTKPGIKKGRISTIYQHRSAERNWTVTVKQKQFPNYQEKLRRLRAMSAIRAVSLFTTVSTNKWWRRSRRIWIQQERQARSIHSSYQNLRLPTPPWAC